MYVSLHRAVITHMHVLSLYCRGVVTSATQPRYQSILGHCNCYISCLNRHAFKCLLFSSVVGREHRINVGLWYKCYLPFIVCKDTNNKPVFRAGPGFIFG